MKKKSILPISRGEFRAIAVTSLVICLSVILPPHLVPLLQPVKRPIVEIDELEGTNAEYSNPQGQYRKPRSSEYIDALPEREKKYPRNSQKVNSSEYRHTASKPQNAYKNSATRASGVSCTSFDPNTISGDTLLSWGWHSYMVRNMLNYRNSGGKFRKPHDLARIYGMDSLTYTRIAGCIDIAKEKISAVYVNTADTAQWIALPGIGKTLSRRIIKFRDKLGGFYNIEQVGSTYGISTETFQMIRPYLRISSSLKTVNLTTATEAQLASHPYISYKQARVMINYFDQHGRPQSLDELSNLYIADSIWLARITPYFTIDTLPIN